MASKMWSLEDQLGNRCADDFNSLMYRAMYQLCANPANQTMLRIRDPGRSIPFYTDLFGMTLVDTLDFPQYGFKLFFLATLPEGEKVEKPGTRKAHDYLWSIEGTALELTWNYGTENDESFKYHPSNEERDGFGHIAFNVDDVYEACEKLEQKGVTFKKKPDEG